MVPPAVRVLAPPGAWIRADDQSVGDPDIAGPRFWHAPPAASAETLPAVSSAGSGELGRRAVRRWDDRWTGVV